MSAVVAFALSAVTHPIHAGLEIAREPTPGSECAMPTSCETDVANCPIFRTMSPEDRDAILLLSDFQTHAHGHTIIRQRDNNPSGLWMLRSGSCEVLANILYGGEQQIAFLSPGAVFGELSFFDPGMHSATVRVVKDAETMHFSIEAFERLEMNQPLTAYKLLRNLGRIMAQKLRRMDRFTVDMFAYTGKSVE